MKPCIICGGETKHPSYDFCEKCFNSSIQELESRYGKKEGPSDPTKESREAQANNPLAEDVTH
jgi:hypothetical protein